MSDYMTVLLDELQSAEHQLRHAIQNRHNPYADNGEQRFKDTQANVDRLHKLIRTAQPTAVEGDK